MPNWVTNTLTITGSEEDIQKVKNQLNQPYTKKWQDGTQETYSNPVIAFWNITRPPMNKLDEYFGVHGYADGGEQGNTPMNWYNFNNREWGTKWDIGVVDGEASKYSDTQLVYTGSETELQYGFNTAWAPPIPAFDALAEQHPNLEITLEWEEEQGFGGTYVWADGEGYESESYDIPESHADYSERDNLDGCNCNNYEDEDDWFEDCPREAVLELQAEQQLQVVGE
jgi:hypothetical protein